MSLAALPALPSTSSPLSFAVAMSSAITNSGRQLAYQTAIFVVVILAIVAIICGTILLIWNDGWTTPNRLHLQIRSSSSLVQWMLGYFFNALVPAFQRLGRATENPRHQPPLPLFTSPRVRELHLATPQPAMLRDRSSFRVPLNSYSGHPHRLPVSSSALLASASSAPPA